MRSRAAAVGSRPRGAADAGQRPELGDRLARHAAVLRGERGGEKNVLRSSPRARTCGSRRPSPLGRRRPCGRTPRTRPLRRGLDLGMVAAIHQRTRSAASCRLEIGRRAGGTSRHPTLHQVGACFSHRRDGRTRHVAQAPARRCPGEAPLPDHAAADHFRERHTGGFIARERRHLRRRPTSSACFPCRAPSFDREFSSAPCPSSRNLGRDARRGGSRLAARRGGCP